MKSHNRESMNKNSVECYVASALHVLSNRKHAQLDIFLDVIFYKANTV